MNFTICMVICNFRCFFYNALRRCGKAVSGVKNGWGLLKNNKIFLALRFYMIIFRLFEQKFQTRLTCLFRTVKIDLKT